MGSRGNGGLRDAVGIALLVTVTVVVAGGCFVGFGHAHLIEPRGSTLQPVCRSDVVHQEAVEVPKESV